MAGGRFWESRGCEVTGERQSSAAAFGGGLCLQSDAQCHRGATAAQGGVPEPLSSYATFDTRQPKLLEVIRLSPLSPRNTGWYHKRLQISHEGERLVTHSRSVRSRVNLVQRKQDRGYFTVSD